MLGILVGRVSPVGVKERENAGRGRGIILALLWEVRVLTREQEEIQKIKERLEEKELELDALQKSYDEYVEISNSVEKELEQAVEHVRKRRE